MITCQLLNSLCISVSQHCHLPSLLSVSLITSGGGGRRVWSSVYTPCASPGFVYLPSTEGGAVGDNMDPQGAPVAWKLH